MACPEYQRNRKCGYHSKHWQVSKEHEQRYCLGDHKSCPTFQDYNKLEGAIAETVDGAAHLEEFTEK